MIQKKKILFDTDIGSDIDDALALAYLLNNPKCDLLGITTVSGEPVERAMIADSICEIYSQNIPIYPGISDPIKGTQIQPTAQHKEVIKKYKHKTSFPLNQSVLFLQKTIREYPHEVVLLATGPLTNIATLFEIDPEIPSLLANFVTMTGVYRDKFTSCEKWTFPEWNTRMDPEAVDIVFNAIPDNNQIIGLDITAQVYENSLEIEKMFKQYLPKIYLDFEKEWIKKTENVTFHDPLAATVIFNDKVCNFNQTTIEVELNNKKMNGMTKLTNTNKGKHRIAVDVSRQAFFQEFYSVFISKKR
jgi:purine nucleosidase